MSRRSRLETLAAIHQVAWSFSTRPSPFDDPERGEIVGWSEEVEDDQPARPPVFIVRRPGRRGIELIYAGNPQALDLAEHLALSMRQSFSVRIVASDEEQRRLRREEVGQRLLHEPDLAPSSLAALLASTNVRLVVCDGLALGSAEDQLTSGTSVR